MHRGFSVRRQQAQPQDMKLNVAPTEERCENDHQKRPDMTRGLSKRILQRLHSRSHKTVYNGAGESKSQLISIPANGTMDRSLSRREKIVHVIANPDTLFKNEGSAERDESRFNPDPKSVILRTFFSPKVDFGPSLSPLYATQGQVASAEHASTLDPDTHIFDATLLPSHITADLPVGYSMRPLTKGDYDRGFLEVLRVAGKVGYVSSKRWDERCELLRKKAIDRDEYVLVIVEDKKDRVVGVGRWVVERGFMNNLATNGRIEDIAVSRDMKGKKFGLRILESLVHISTELGCHKTVVNCSEANEAFHGQLGFVQDGVVMMLSHSTHSNGSRRVESIAHMS